MVFSSNLFLFVFIPCFFSLYFLLPRSAQNIAILLTSLLFYGFGAGSAVLVLIGSIAINQLAAGLMERTDGPTRTVVFWAAIVLNVSALFYYKYAGFVWDIANDVSNGLLAKSGVSRPAIALPIGISFFTFQAISYIADIYRRFCRPARNLTEFGMYHSLFPQLIAGPIVRYAEIRRDIPSRAADVNMVARGATRFVIGLAKKVILADNVGQIADEVFSLPATELSPGSAWIGTIAYTLQIYFDFSGYSDMAIGLGLMLGFRFPENFNHPYRAASVTEFWRRWHMTLSRWFRDYVYIPLGGNRHGTLRTYFNLVIVFFLCGLWHGAGYTFIVWGVFHGALLVFERLVPGNIILRGLAGHAWTLLTVMIGWVFFRSNSLGQSIEMLRALTFTSGVPEAAFPTWHLLSPDRIFYLLLGIAIVFVPAPRHLWDNSALLMLVQRIGTLALFLTSIMFLSSNTFNPFIYFRF
jgi:alginate O-acetyltransferase complex protein AlgI